MNPTFFNEEIRNGFRVDAERKKHWACMLTMLEAFLAVCTRHRLRCFATDGTLLGAVRHQGFIPWDDDVDMGMPRPDYDRFLRLAPRELPGHFTLVHNGNELENPYPFARIRDRRTTCIVRHFRNLRIHHGIFIDIFPLDGAPAGARETEAYRQRLVSLMDRSRNLLGPFLSDAQGPQAASARRWMMPLNLIRRQRIHRQYNRFMRSHPFDTSPRVFEYWFMPPGSPIEPMLWDRRDFDQAVLLDFEHLKLPCPAGYDHYLRMRYGDYWTYPPVRKGSHAFFLLDSERPYTDELPPAGLRWRLQQLWAATHR